MTTPLGFGALSQRRLLCVLSASLLSVTAQAATLTRDNGAAVGDNVVARPAVQMVDAEAAKPVDESGEAQPLDLA